LSFVPGVDFPQDLQDACYFICRGDELLGLEQARPWRPMDEVQIAQMEAGIMARHYLGSLGGRPCVAAALGKNVAPGPGLDFHHLYSLLESTDRGMFALAGRAVQIVRWHEQHRFCGRCATACEQLKGERAMRCPACGLTCYPRLAPCIMVLVHRGEELLLARNRRFPDGMYSVLAGFVDPGETVEQALRREVDEEVGLQVGPCHYLDSEAWPFPHQLMLGFHATWRGGDIQVDGKEIEDACWWHYSRLPQVPGEYSLSGRLIRWFIRHCKSRDCSGTGFAGAALS